jgi:hypothetical protein
MGGRGPQIQEEAVRGYRTDPTKDPKTWDAHEWERQGCSVTGHTYPRILSTPTYKSTYDEKSLVFPLT